MRIPLRLALLPMMLFPACGRTGAVTRPHSDASQDQGGDSARGPDDGAQEDSDHERPQERSGDACCAADLGRDLDGPSTCGAKIAGTRQVPAVEIVVDNSETMAELVPGTDQSRWEMSRDVLKQVMAALTSASPAVGLTFLPDSDTCSPSPASVPASPVTEQTRAQLMAALDSVGAPAGTRSTAAALATARADATAKAYPNGLLLGPALLVLLSGGAPDPSPRCSLFGDPASDLENEVRAAYAAGVPTCVFALPGIGDARDRLFTLAKLGVGVSDSPDAAPFSYCFQDCDQAAGSASLLLTGINCVLDRGTPLGTDCYVPYPQTSSCFIPLDMPEEIDLNTAQVSLTDGTSSPRTVARVDCSSEGTDGWDLLPASAPKTLTFCGQSCADFVAAWSYTITFGCRED